MTDWNQEKVTRLALTLLILLAGLAMIPFIDIPVEAITWELLAGVYEPKLNVHENKGAPGSVFAFTGSDYPPLSNAAIYVNGRQVGSTLTNAGGTATFTLNTAGAAVGQYNVTMEINVNASATESIELKAGEPIATPPPNFVGPEFSLRPQTYLPVIFAN